MTDWKAEACAHCGLVWRHSNTRRGPLPVALHLAVDEVGKAVQTHAIGHGLWVFICPPDERRGKADGEAMHVRLMGIGLQPSLGRERELHHIRGAPRMTGIDDFLLCTTRGGKEVASSTDEVIILGAKPGGGKGQSDDIHIGASITASAT